MTLHEVQSIVACNGIVYAKGAKNFQSATNFPVLLFGFQPVAILKEYYEIVGESRPLSAFFPKQADFFTEMRF